MTSGRLKTRKERKEFSTILTCFVSLYGVIVWVRVNMKRTTPSTVLPELPSPRQSHHTNY